MRISLTKWGQSHFIRISRPSRAKGRDLSGRSRFLTRRHEEGTLAAKPLPISQVAARGDVDDRARLRRRRAVFASSREIPAQARPVRSRQSPASCATSAARKHENGDCPHRAMSATSVRQWIASGPSAYGEPKSPISLPARPQWVESGHLSSLTRLPWFVSYMNVLAFDT